MAGQRRSFIIILSKPQRSQELSAFAKVIAKTTKRSYNWADFKLCPKYVPYFLHGFHPKQSKHFLRSGKPVLVSGEKKIALFFRTFSQNGETCHGEWRREICNLAFGDLPQIVKQVKERRNLLFFFQLLFGNENNFFFNFTSNHQRVTMYKTWNMPGIWERFHSRKSAFFGTFFSTFYSAFTTNSAF